MGPTWLPQVTDGTSVGVGSGVAVGLGVLVGHGVAVGRGVGVAVGLGVLVGHGVWWASAWPSAGALAWVRWWDAALAWAGSNTADCTE